MKKKLLVFFLTFSLTAYSQIETEASNITIECGEVSSIQNWLDSNGGAVASTACGTVVWSNDYTGTSDICDENITVTFTAVNSCDSYQTFAVLTIQDTQAPTIVNPPPNITIECGETDTISDLIAEDNCSSGVTISFFDSSIGGSCLGEEIITRTWTAIDDCGNVNTHIQTISFNDFTSPNITTTATDLSVACDGSGNLADLNNWLSTNGGALASDVCSDVTWSNDFTTLDSDCSVTVSSLVTFTASDACGNLATTSATFTIDEVLNECPDTSITLSSQAEVDAFTTNYPNCTELNGSLTISGDDITDLTPLSGITSIVGLSVSNTSLETLSGLENIVQSTDIAFFTISNNSQLTNISALSNLNSFAALDTLEISNNPLLLNLEGLEGVTELLDIFVFNNSSLQDFAGLSSLESILNGMIINNNSSLISFNGLTNLSFAEEIIIENNNSLINLNGLDLLTQIGGLQILNNNAFENLNGIEMLNSVVAVYIEDNMIISDISSIENIQLSSTLSIHNNPNLSICNYPSICNAISDTQINSSIENNAPGCNSIAEVAVDCGILPTNDDCEDAITIQLNSTLDAYNTGATQSTQIPSCNDSANRVDVWFSFTTSNDGIFDIAVSGGTYNLQVWEGDCANLTPVPDTCGVSELLDANLDFNTTYYLQVWSDDLDRSTGVFSVDIANTTLSLNDVTFESFSILPNPTNAVLQYSGSDIVDNVTIYNAIGQVMLTLTPKSTSGLIDISNFSSALYFIQVSIGKTFKTFKILKE